MHTPDPATLRPADAAELAHALQFDGRRAFRPSGEMMAKITAAHLVEQLTRAGFVVMKKPGAPQHEAPAPRSMRRRRPGSKNVLF